MHHHRHRRTRVQTDAVEADRTYQSVLHRKKIPYRKAACALFWSLR
jgi:hypothetical protein